MCLVSSVSEFSVVVLHLQLSPRFPPNNPALTLPFPPLSISPVHDLLLSKFAALSEQQRLYQFPMFQSSAKSMVTSATFCFDTRCLTNSSIHSFLFIYPINTYQVPRICLMLLKLLCRLDYFPCLFIGVEMECLFTCATKGIYVA